MSYSLSHKFTKDSLLIELKGGFAGSTIEISRDEFKSWLNGDYKKGTSIPKGVYYSLENDNFYSATTARGMGVEFHGMYKHVSDLFPTNLKEARKIMEEG